MQEPQQYLGRLEPGMDVCDVDGNKFGTIERAYRHDMGSTSAQEAGGVGTMTQAPVLQVKSGLLGLGKHYYIPFSAIQDVTTDCVFVGQAKDRLHEMGWDVRPEYLDRLT